MDDFQRNIRWATGIGFVLLSLSITGIALWDILSDYIQPKTPTDRKELVNVFVLIAAGVIGFLTATAAVGNLYISRRNLQQQRDLEEQRAQNDALQAYYQQMGDLLTEHDLKKSKPDDDVAMLGRAQTLTVLARLTKRRKSGLLRFLYGADLINKHNSIVDLNGADLDGADLRHDNLREVNLGGANLGDANFLYADLGGADLGGANLFGAYLRLADLHEANLHQADLGGADLTHAKLGRADLSRANLRGADLSSANLREADLGGADLSGADLNDDTDLSDANLANADLSHAKGWTEKQLGVTKSLDGATMPNGQKYEDWIKDKKAQGQDEKNE